MSCVRILLGAASPSEDWQTALARIESQPAWQPFDERAVSLVTRLSQILLTDRQMRQFPELLALGHWFRGASLKDKILAWRSRQERDVIVRGRGLAFHLAPANVDSIFMYSWLISLLAGNVNVVRLSQSASPQIASLLALIGQVVAEGPTESLANRLLLLSYGHDDAITLEISRRCQVRMVWGGDATVAHIRSLALRPTAVEVCFPDRFSLAVLQAARVSSLDAAGLQVLAGNFYNDAFWFGQQACSSPRLVVWIGDDEEVRTAQEIFWHAVVSEVEQRQAENTPAMGMARLATSFEYAARGFASPASCQFQQMPLRLALEVPLRGSLKDLHCGNGLFLETSMLDPADLARQLSDKEQTMAVFGLDRAAIERLVDVLPMRAIDRVVPIGQALDFNLTWDGADLLTSLTRRITLPAS
ncbi:MAG: acyl-CoA reductase [Accumulibacter sp.]